jgi:hypothetical protein
MHIVNEYISMNNIESPARILMNSLERFYNTRAHWSKFIFLRDTKQSGISLRTFDKYTTQYVVSHTVTFPGTNKSVHDSYREQLKSWKKRMFDPNARDHSRPMDNSKDQALLSLFNLVIPGVGTIENTNVGQLNFFRWVIQNNVYDLIVRDLVQIKIFIKGKSKMDKKVRSKPLVIVKRSRSKSPARTRRDSVGSKGSKGSRGRVSSTVSAK